MKAVLWIFLVNVVAVAALFLQLLADGEDSGSKMMWMDVFPLVVFFMLGRRGGFNSTLALCGVFVLMLFVPAGLVSVYPYIMATRIRFMVTFGFVGVMAFIFEGVRCHFQMGMEYKHADLIREQHKLAAASQRIRDISIRDPITGANNRLYLIALVAFTCHYTASPLTLSIQLDAIFFAQAGHSTTTTSEKNNQ